MFISIPGIGVACGLGEGEGLCMPGMFISIWVGDGVGEDSGVGDGDACGDGFPGIRWP
jgi:hypothetical protein